MTYPILETELTYYLQGHRFIAGVDEVGRGCLAGPVVAAAVILRLDRVPPGINDSKLLSPKQRLGLSQQIQKSALCFAVGTGEVEEIDSYNIFNASKMAMIRALQKLSPVPDLLLLDGNFSIEYSARQVSIVKGDQISLSIAAASILAKVYRDGLMEKMDTELPGYHFAKHKGYGSREHRLALQEKGRSPIHRKSFSWTPV